MLPLYSVTALLLFYALITVGVVVLIFKRSKNPNVISAKLLLVITVVDALYLFISNSNNFSLFDVTTLRDIYLITVVFLFFNFSYKLFPRRFQQSIQHHGHLCARNRFVYVIVSKGVSTHDASGSVYLHKQNKKPLSDKGFMILVRVEGLEPPRLPARS